MQEDSEYKEMLKRHMDHGHVSSSEMYDCERRNDRFGDMPVAFQIGFICALLFLLCAAAAFFAYVPPLVKVIVLTLFILALIGIFAGD